MSGVLIFLAVVLGVFAVSLILPTLVAATMADGHGTSYLLLAALLIFFAGGIFLALQGRSLQIGRVGSYVLLLMCWVCLSAAGAVPFVVVGELMPIDAVFEAISGLTTTGASILPDPSKLPPSLVLWRAELQWLGGFLTLLSIILILAPAGVGGLPDRHIKLIEHAGRGGDFRIAQAIAGIAFAYVLLTILCFVGLVISGIPLFDAACLTFAAVSTGGFLPVEGTLSRYSNPSAEAILTVFMILGATSVLWQRMILQGRRQLLIAHRESYFVVVIALGAGIAYGIAAVLEAKVEAGHIGEALNLLRSGIVTGVSLITTTGFQTAEVPFSTIPLTVVIFAAFVGGGTFSTAGGIKMYRFGGMIVQSFRELGRLVYPHGIRPAHFGSQPYDIQLMKAIWSYFAVAILLVVVGSILLAFDFPQYEGALLAAISTFANIGALYGPQWQVGAEAWPAYWELSALSKSASMALMLLGRIEILALFGIINLTYWTNR